MDRIFEKQVNFAKETSYKVEELQQLIKLSCSNEVEKVKNDCYAGESKSADSYVECVQKHVASGDAQRRRQHYMGQYFEMQFDRCIEQRDDEVASHNCMKRLSEQLQTMIGRYKELDQASRKRV